jgi:hypothetical protein
MDVETADAIQTLARMVDHANSTKSIGALAFNLAVISICAQRANGTIPRQMESTIAEFFDEFEAVTADEPYEKSREVFLKARAMWDASQPN